MSQPLDYDEIVRLSVRAGVPKAVAERAAAMEITRRSAQLLGYGTIAPGTEIQAPLLVDGFARNDPSKWAIGPHTPEIAGATLHRVADSKTIAHVSGDGFALCHAHFHREFDTLFAVFSLPPRTKKNSLRWFGRQSIAYTRYRDAIIQAVVGPRVELALPLPDQPFNLKAIFYVDSSGEQADLFGLLQGIADALENAHVVSNDWYFRTTDGSRIITGDERPRVEVTITPIED